MTRSEIIKFLILRTIGNFLLVLAIFGALATFGLPLYYEISFRIMQLRGVHYTVIQPKAEVGLRKSPSFGDILIGAKEPLLIPIDTNFDILIAKIGANARVFPNIDPSNSAEFLPVLQRGVAHAKGTVFPGQKGNIYLFAHSTDNFWNVGRYNAVFYLLRNLSPGDEIVIFYQGVRHNYLVSNSKIVEGNEVSYLVNAQEGEEQLILQTCWPPGTSWKRLLVFARPK